MIGLFPASGFLYIHDSAIDLYLRTLREAIQSVPQGALQLEYNCRPIITDYSATEEAENSGIVLGYGFHPSDFDGLRSPREGLVFCLNPPYAPGVKGVRMYHTKHGDGVIPVRSSFVIGEHRFLLTDQEFNLDDTVCGELSTGEIYKKPEHRPDQASLDDF